MMNGKFIGSACVLVLGAAMVTGCATRHNANDKENLAPADYAISELVVVAFTEDDAIRQKFEEGFSGRMTELGVSTDFSFQAMPALEDLGDEEKLQAAKAGTSADTSVLIEVIKENEKARGADYALFGVWIAGLLSNEDSLENAGFWGGLAASGAAGTYTFRVTLWNMEDNSLLWRIDTDSYVYDLAKTRNSAAKMADLIHRELKADGLIH